MALHDDQSSINLSQNEHFNKRREIDDKMIKLAAEVPQTLGIIHVKGLREASVELNSLFRYIYFQISNVKNKVEHIMAFYSKKFYKKIE